MTSNLFNNSDQTFKTTVSDEEGNIIDAAPFLEAVYTIFNADCSAELVVKKLSLTEIVVIVDDGNNIFQTTLLEADMTMAAGQYPHSFKVTNSAGLQLPPIFNGNVSIVEVCKV